MIGIDEVGRGCWAGPLVVVAARQKLTLPSGLDDSKRLTKHRRQALIGDIVHSCDLGIGEVSAAEIDHFGLTAAMRLGVERALTAISAENTESVIMDGTINYCPVRFTSVLCEAKADGTYPIVSAASIYAKVHRDSYMADMAEEYPGYGFAEHVGYGTKKHHDALMLYGVTGIHRRSYRPIKELLMS